MALLAAPLALISAAHAGHEVSYYPSFYPQEIRIELLDPETAGREFSNSANPLHAYIGTPARFAGDVPAHLKSIVSLRSFIVASINPRSPQVKDRDARCRDIEGAAAALARQPDVVVHPYPVMPYHADYLGHADRGPDGVTSASPAAGSGATQGDVGLDDIPVSELMRKAGIGFALWPAPPWVKEGWYQAYHLLRSAVGDPADRERADAAYTRLTHRELKDPIERLDLERELVTALTRGCERAVIGYRVRREFYNDDFSGGIENILADSQSGFNAPMFVRTVKLKDFPWNGWLRVGIDARPASAWNPVAGFTDPAGRLVWSTAADDAFLAVPHNSRWVQNRVESLVEEDAKPRQSVPVPADTLMLQAGTGRLDMIGPGKGAMTKVSYRVLASSFHDGTQMETSDLLYAYALAFRWGTSGSDGAAFDPAIATATQLMRERLKGVRIVRTEEKTLQLADLTFTYRSPIVEVYLDNASPDLQENALIAPPWSSVPWHVLALMEAAVERGIGAFSQDEAQRRRVPWLDLVRDPVQLARLHALIKDFAKDGYRPAALEKLVGPEAAKARWEALGTFAESNGHLLVTNGPYRLKSWSPDAIVFDVVREFTYPIGLGTFDFHAYPPRALIAGIEHEGNRILISADVETAVKQQRDRRIVRVPLRRDTLRETFPIQTVPRYVIVDRAGKVAAAGTASWTPDGRFAVALPAGLPSGQYTVFTAIFLDGNTINPAIGRVSFKHP